MPWSVNCETGPGLESEDCRELSCDLSAEEVVSIPRSDIIRIRLKDPKIFNGIRN